MNKEDDTKISSIEVISDLIKNAKLSKKEKERLKREIGQEEEGGKGTIWLKSNDEFNKVAEKCKGDLLSPGGASGRCKISRARIHQLEAEGKITVYRIKAKEIPFSDEDFKEEVKDLPFWIRPFIYFKKPRAGCYVFVDMDSLYRYMKKQNKEKK